MSIKEPIRVQDALVVARDDGAHKLVISTKTGLMELEFPAAVWAKLADSARWFNMHVAAIKLPSKGEE